MSNPLQMNITILSTGELIAPESLLPDDPVLSAAKLLNRRPIPKKKPFPFY
jgi:hypothetical protein